MLLFPHACYRFEPRLLGGVESRDLVDALLELDDIEVLRLTAGVERLTVLGGEDEVEE